MASGRTRVFLNAAALLPAFAPYLGAQGTITGRITAEGTGQPVAGARIIVLRTSQNAVAGEDGRYIIRNVRPGATDVQVLNVG